MDNQNNTTNTPTARLLLDAFRAFESDLANKLLAKGFDDITPGNFNILRHLNPEGMRLTELARDAQISKQAIGKMIKELEEKGYVQLIPDQTDGRAKFVHLTSKGKKMINLATTLVAKMEESYQTLLGKKAYMQLRQSVGQLSAWHQQKEK